MDRKYYEYKCCLQYEWANYALFKFMQTENKGYDMLIYEEEGKFYEFLTGKFLGVRKNNNGAPFIFSDEFGYVIPLTGYSSFYAAPLTAERFAFLAKKYLKDKDKIIPYLEKRFDKWRGIDPEGLEKENKKKRVEAEAENWIDNILNNRK